MTEHRGSARITTAVRARMAAFLSTETAGAALLLAAATIALAWANSPWSDAYDHLWDTYRRFGIGSWSIETDLRHVVSDALMALFFLVVGLEIKREFVEGELRDRRTAALPIVAAIGGMVVPALIYVAFNAGGEGARGWAIPMATDIAFALGVLALAARSAPPALTTFLLALAIVDDIGAITVIALFYSDGVALPALGAAAASAVALAAAARVRHRLGRAWWPVYAVLGLGLWAAVAASGVHATIAGVALGLLTPTTPDDELPSPLERLEHALHPWTSYLVVPVFALANAGVRVAGDALGDALASPVTIGVFLGLVAGKAVGISVAARIGVATGVARPMPGVGARSTAGVASIAGIGFTVALFVTDLAFGDGALGDHARIGILAASATAGVLGWLLLRGVPPYTPGSPGPTGGIT